MSVFMFCIYLFDVAADKPCIADGDITILYNGIMCGF